jgi:hypothetical protein
MVQSAAKSSLEQREKANSVNDEKAYRFSIFPIDICKSIQFKKL